MGKIMGKIGFTIDSGFIKENDNRFHLIIRGNLGINEVSELKSILKTIDFEGNEIVVEFTAIEAFDLSTIQLLYALKNELATKDKTMVLSCEEGNYVNDLVANTGFGDLLIKRH